MEKNFLRLYLCQYREFLSVQKIFFTMTSFFYVSLYVSTTPKENFKENSKENSKAQRKFSLEFGIHNLT